MAETGAAPLFSARGVEDVRRLYDFFDVRRERREPFDEADMQNIHAWMRAVTEALERTAYEASDV